MITIIVSTLLFVLLSSLLAVCILFARRLFVPEDGIAITINDSTHINARYGETLLQALSDNHVYVPSACAGAGTCGLCHVLVGLGTTSPTPIEKVLLNNNDLIEGKRLACQIHLRQPLSIQLPEDILSVRSWRATVLSNRPLSPLIREIRLQAESDFLNFQPGDFMQVVAPAASVDLCDIDPGDAHRSAWESLGVSHFGVQWDEQVSRAYSLANRPTDTKTVTLMVRLALAPHNESSTIPPGVVSSWLFTRKPGDLVKLSGPHAGFHINDENRELVFVGGGVGMAPLRAMIYQQIERSHVLPMTFFYGARTQADLLYREEFDH